MSNNIEYITNSLKSINILPYSSHIEDVIDKYFENNSDFNAVTLISSEIQSTLHGAVYQNNKDSIETLELIKRKNDNNMELLRHLHNDTKNNEITYEKGLDYYTRSVEVINKGNMDIKNGISSTDIDILRLLKKIKSYTNKNKEELLKELEYMINSYQVRSNIQQEYINLYKNYESDKSKAQNKKDPRMVYKFKLVANKFIDKTLDFKDKVSELDKYNTKLDKEKKMVKDILKEQRLENKDKLDELWENYEKAMTDDQKDKILDEIEELEKIFTVKEGSNAVIQYRPGGDDFIKDNKGILVTVLSSEYDTELEDLVLYCNISSYNPTDKFKVLAGPNKSIKDNLEKINKSMKQKQKYSKIKKGFVKVGKYELKQLAKLKQKLENIKNDIYIISNKEAKIQGKYLDISTSRDYYKHYNIKDLKILARKHNLKINENYSADDIIIALITENRKKRRLREVDIYDKTNIKYYLNHTVKDLQKLVYNKKQLKDIDNIVKDKDKLLDMILNKERGLEDKKKQAVTKRFIQEYQETKIGEKDDSDYEGSDSEYEGSDSEYEDDKDIDDEKSDKFDKSDNRDKTEEDDDIMEYYNEKYGELKGEDDLQTKFGDVFHPTKDIAKNYKKIDYLLEILQLENNPISKEQKTLIINAINSLHRKQITKALTLSDSKKKNEDLKKIERDIKITIASYMLYFFSSIGFIQFIHPNFNTCNYDLNATDKTKKEKNMKTVSQDFNTPEYFSCLLTKYYLMENTTQKINSLIVSRLKDLNLKLIQKEDTVCNMCNFKESPVHPGAKICNECERDIDKNIRKDLKRKRINYPKAPSNIAKDHKFIKLPSVVKDDKMDVDIPKNEYNRVKYIFKLETKYDDLVNNIKKLNKSDLNTLEKYKNRIKDILFKIKKLKLIPNHNLSVKDILQGNVPENKLDPKVMEVYNHVTNKLNASKDKLEYKNINTEIHNKFAEMDFEPETTTKKRPRYTFKPKDKNELQNDMYELFEDEIDLPINELKVYIDDIFKNNMYDDIAILYDEVTLNKKSLDKEKVILVKEIITSKIKKFTLEDMKKYIDVLDKRYNSQSFKLILKDIYKIDDLSKANKHYIKYILNVNENENKVSKKRKRQSTGQDFTGEFNSVAGLNYLIKKQRLDYINDTPQLILGGPYTNVGDKEVIPLFSKADIKKFKGTVDNPKEYKRQFWTWFSKYDNIDNEEDYPKRKPIKDKIIKTLNNELWKGIEVISNNIRTIKWVKIDKDNESVIAMELKQKNNNINSLKRYIIGCFNSGNIKNVKPNIKETKISTTEYIHGAPIPPISSVNLPKLFKKIIGDESYNITIKYSDLIPEKVKNSELINIVDELTITSFSELELAYKILNLYKNMLQPYFINDSNIKENLYYLESEKISKHLITIEKYLSKFRQVYKIIPKYTIEIKSKGKDEEGDLASVTEVMSFRDGIREARIIARAKSTEDLRNKSIFTTLQTSEANRKKIIGILDILNKYYYNDTEYYIELIDILEQYENKKDIQPKVGKKQKNKKFFDMYYDSSIEELIESTSQITINNPIQEITDGLTNLNVIN